MLIPHTEYRTAGHIPNGPVVKEVTIRFFIFFPRRIINDLKSYNGRRHLAAATAFLCQNMGVCYFSRSDLSCFLFYGDYSPQSMHKWKTLLFLGSFSLFCSVAKSGTGNHRRTSEVQSKRPSERYVHNEGIETSCSATLDDQWRTGRS